MCCSTPHSFYKIPIAFGFSPKFSPQTCRMLSTYRRPDTKPVVEYRRRPRERLLYFDDGIYWQFNVVMGSWTSYG
jgi:hypothetical protein